MILIEKTDTYGWEAAIRGMRNPKNSWDKSDSSWGCTESMRDKFCPEICIRKCRNAVYVMGENDLKLAKTLAGAGTDHGKFLRMIVVNCDLTAPLYWWKEFDTYKVGTVADSCSTMHKIHAKEFTLDDFSYEHLFNEPQSYWRNVFSSVVSELNKARKKYLETNDKKYWWQMIQLLPSSYNQKRTVQMNYAVLKNMYHARKNHKLDEWHTFCRWVESLPYSELITG